MTNITQFPKRKPSEDDKTRYIGTLKYLVTPGHVLDADETEQFLKRKDEVERKGRERL